MVVDAVGDTVGTKVVGVEVVGDTVGTKVVGVEVVGLNVGDVVGSEVVGNPDGDAVGSEVVGDPVGDSVTHCDRAQEERQVDWPGGMMQVWRETVRADPQLRQKAISLGCRGCTVG